MTRFIIRTANTASEPEYFQRFHRKFGFSLREIHLPENCAIIQPVDNETVVTFAWNRIVGKKVQVLENSFIRMIDTGFRQKFQRSPITSKLLSNLLTNIDLGVHKTFLKTEIYAEKELLSWIYAADEDTNVVTKFDAKISRSELRRLDWNLSGDEAYLSNDIIDYYLLLLNERSEIRNDLPKTKTVPAHIFTLISFYGYKDILKWNWIRKFDLNFDILLIPICESSHWSIVIVDMTAQTIQYYDSLRFGNAKIHLKMVFNFLNEHNQQHNKFVLNLDDWKLKIAANIPMQENNYDCGVFCCQYANYISRNHPINFEQKDIKELRKKMLYEIYKEKLLN